MRLTTTYVRASLARVNEAMASLGDTSGNYLHLGSENGYYILWKQYATGGGDRVITGTLRECYTASRGMEYALAAIDRLRRG